MDANLEVGGTAKDKIHFEECVTKLNGPVAGKCVPHSPGTANGLIETNALSGSLRPHELSPLVKDELFELSPEGTGVPFVDLILGTGKYVISNLIEITGKVFLKDCKNEGLVDKIDIYSKKGR